MASSTELYQPMGEDPELRTAVKAYRACRKAYRASKKAGDAEETTALEKKMMEARTLCETPKERAQIDCDAVDYDAVDYDVRCQEGRSMPERRFVCPMFSCMKQKSSAETYPWRPRCDWCKVKMDEFCCCPACTEMVQQEVAALNHRPAVEDETPEVSFVMEYLSYINFA